MSRSPEFEVVLDRLITSEAANESLSDELRSTDDRVKELRMELHEVKADLARVRDDRQSAETRVEQLEKELLDSRRATEAARTLATQTQAEMFAREDEHNLSVWLEAVHAVRVQRDKRVVHSDLRAELVLGSLAKKLLGWDNERAMRAVMDALDGKPVTL